MAGKASRAIQLLRSQKARLIQILSSDADFVLQHADSRCLVSPQGYQQIKACRVPSEKVRDLLDHVTERGSKAAHGLLELLKDQELQENFPRLDFIKDIQLNTPAAGGKKKSRQKKRTMDVQETIPPKKMCSRGINMVTEKQLMTVARAIGQSWRQVGVLALEIPSVKLEQIIEDHSQHVERVFAMLRYWRNRQGYKATAAHLHCLLSHHDLALPTESIHSLLDND